MTGWRRDGIVGRYAPQELRSRSYDNARKAREEEIRAGFPARVPWLRAMAWEKWRRPSETKAKHSMPLS
jgi:hypothetical protein